MREIKFRAWDKNEKRWLSFLEVNLAGFRNEISFYQDTSFELMQYTGLKDKNGKEIYEGDIMRVLDEVGQVYYDDNNVCFCIDVERDYNPCIGRYEVIGNIYENPELLTK